jgi:monovalent cation:H+ antiporter-2, CPA2 family
LLGAIMIGKSLAAMRQAPGILDAASLSTARLLVITTPGAQQARRLVEAARALNPGVDMVVRTHSDAERRRLEDDGVGLVVTGERELALGMPFYALRSLGVREGEARVFIDTARAEGRTDAERHVGPVQGTPELRHHPDRDAADLS